MSQLEVDKIIPSSGTTLTIGDSGDSIDITSGATITNFKSTGIDDNATSTAITIDSLESIGIGTSSPFNSRPNSLTISNTAPTLYLEDTDSGSYTNAQLLFSGGDFTYSTGIRSGTGTSGTVERCRIDSSGNVVIGSGGLDVSGIGGTYTALNIRAGSGYSTVYGQTTATTTNKTALSLTGATSGASSGGAGELLGVIQISCESDSSTNATGYINFYTGSGGGVSEKMRIQSNGRITTFGQSTTNGALNLLGEAGAGYKAIVFARVGGGSEVGSIVTNTSSTSYNTSSDYRLKENVVEMTGATERLKQLQPKRFNFIDDADNTVDGFLAHEVSSIVPEAVSGEKDAMRTEEYEVTPAELDEEGNIITEAVMGTREVPDYQGIDQSKLVPLLVATIKELEARIEALENA